MPPGYATPAEADDGVHDDYFAAAFADIDALRGVRCRLAPHDRPVRGRARPTRPRVEAGAAVIPLWPTGPVADSLLALVRDTTVTEQHRAGALDAVADGPGPGRAGEHGRAGSPVRVRVGRPGADGSVETLIGALSDRGVAVRCLPPRPSRGGARLVPAVLTAVLEQTPVDGASDQLVDALVGVVARPSGPLGATYEWGPVLAWAFPGPRAGGRRATRAASCVADARPGTTPRRARRQRRRVGSTIRQRQPRR